MVTLSFMISLSFFRFVFFMSLGNKYISSNDFNTMFDLSYEKLCLKIISGPYVEDTKSK